MKQLFHQHLLVKAYVTQPPMQEEHLEKWLSELVSDINMKIVIPPRAKYVDAVGNKGLTANVGIETSHIAIHVWDEPVPAMLQMDVYSCSCFENSTILKKLNEFDLVKYELMTIDRNDNFIVTQHHREAGMA